MKNARMLFLLVPAAALVLCSFTQKTPSLSDPQIQENGVEALRLGGAYLLFAEKYGGEITRKQIAGQREVQVDGCARGSRIFTFTLEVTRAGKTASYPSHSNVLTDAMVSGLKALQAGDSFEFKKIKAYLPNGKDEVDVHSRKFVVV